LYFLNVIVEFSEATGTQFMPECSGETSDSPATQREFLKARTQFKLWGGEASDSPPAYFKGGELPGQ